MPSLHPRYIDTYDSLDHQGDVVETMYGITRCSDFCNLDSVYDTALWRQLFYDSSACFSSSNYLRCLIRGGALERTGAYVDKLQLEHTVDDTTAHLAAIAMLLGQRMRR